MDSKNYYDTDIYSIASHTIVSDDLIRLLKMLMDKSSDTGLHAERMVELSVKIGENLGLNKSSLSLLKMFAVMHDIGKLKIEDSILNKPGKLTEEEWAEMKKHPEYGSRILSDLPGLKSVAGYVLAHHERWDGNGYPRGLKGEDIPMLSRIISVVDTYDAITQDRVYRKAAPKKAAIEEINRCSGTQFDPNVVKAFNEVMN